MSEALLSVRDLSVEFSTYGRTNKVLHNVSLDVPAHSQVALVGESGSGKTTLLQCFNRLVDPDTGTIHVDGEDVRRSDAVALRRRIGYVLQEGGLLPHWTVRRNVELVPWLVAMPNASIAVSSAMALVGFGDHVLDTCYPRELSGGQRQRVAMARALAAEPTVLLLDEPFGALDAITRADLQAMFADVRRRRPVTCVLVTHDLFEARRLADRIAVMRAGRIEQIGTPRAIVERPATEYVARLVEKAGAH